MYPYAMLCVRLQRSIERSVFMLVISLLHVT